MKTMAATPLLHGRKTGPQDGIIAAETPDMRAPYRLPVYVACTLLALLVNYILGKDMAWDTLSYHLYAGFSALNDRFGQDYFPAGPQSYFNPYIYAPFYALTRTSLSSLEISSVLAAVHSIILWLTYDLTVAVCPSTDKRQRFVFGAYGVIFALVNPILLQQLGSTFADITTAELVLAGWLLLAHAIRTPRTTRVIFAGLLLGLATGLKATNAVHVISSFALLIFLPLTLRERVRQGVAYSASLGLGFAVITAAWAYRLAVAFGNPFFPLLNNVFRSPDFTTERLHHLRFIPSTVFEALWRPFAMIDPVTMVHEEMRAPDARYAILCLLIVALVARWLWSRRSYAPPRPLSKIDSASASVLVAVGCGLAADWLLWLSGSGNSRYFLPMSCVAAVVLVGLIFRMFETKAKTRNFIVWGILAAQSVQLWMGTDYRWNGVPWDDHWIRIAVPSKLTSESALFLTIGGQTDSFIAPYLSHGSGLINLSGGYTLSPYGANGTRIAALIKQYAPNIRVLTRGQRLYREEERRFPTSSQVDDSLAPYGLGVEPSDCLTISVFGLPPELEFGISGSRPAEPQSRDTTYLVSCLVVPKRTDDPATIAARGNVDLALDHLEDACPELFQPRRPRTEYAGNNGLRRYLNTDLTAWVSHGTVKFHQPFVGADVVVLGREKDWVSAPAQLRCGRRDGRFFADVLLSSGGK
jgi:hypothetical protein